MHLALQTWQGPGRIHASWRSRLPILSAIVLLHLLFVLSWNLKRHVAPIEPASVVLPIWNVVEPERKLQFKPDTKQEARPETRPNATDRHMPAKTQRKTGNAAPAAPVSPAASAPAAPEVPPVTPGPAIAPRLDYDGITKQALDMDKQREITPAEKLREQQRVNHSPESELAAAAKRGTRGDCQTAYSGMGLLAVVPLVIDTVTSHGCKWK